MTTVEMRSKWIDSVFSSENLPEESALDARPSPSGRHHGTRWFSVMQGIRRSLDVHLKSYYKIDNAFACTVKLNSPCDKLKALTRALTDTGLVDFSCVYLVHPARGTFGVIAVSGAGAKLYPPLLGDDEARRAVQQCDTDSQSFLNVFTRCVFQVKDSNWCVEDVVASKAPWYYDCASAVNGFGLPQDGGWLRHAGMRSVLALPCMQGNDVTGVLTVASKQKSLDHLLLRKLEELCYKVTPVVTDAVVEYSPLLCNRRMASRYESISDFAHEVLGELLNLDRAVAVSIGTGINRTSANVSQSHQQQSKLQQSCGAGRGRRAEEQSVFDATAAVAAAAAAGFTWTAPAAVMPSTQVRPTTQSIQATDTYCTALAEGDLYSVVLTSELPSVPLQGDIPSTILVGDSDRLTPLPLMPIDCEAAANTTAITGANGGAALPHHSQQAAHGLQAHGWTTAPHVAACRSLVERQNVAAAAAEASALDFLRRPNVASRHHQHQLQHQQESGAGARDNVGAAAPSSSERNGSRSTRSLSCLEFSGGVSDAREELVSGSSTASPTGFNPVVKASAASASSESANNGCKADIQVAAAAATVATGSNNCSSSAPRRLQAPCIPAAPCAQAASPASSNRTTESGTGAERYMIESGSTAELAAELCNGSVTASGAPSAWSSKNMESRVMMRGAPLEASVGAVGAGASDRSGASAGPAAAAAAMPMAATQSFATAHGSSCATFYSVAAMETSTTLAFASSSAYGGSSAAQLSGGWTSHGCSVGGGQVGGDLSEVCTSLRGFARGRWSRDSAAAAAAMWNNEASEAFAAAERFTAAQTARAQAPCCGFASGGASVLTDCATASESVWISRARPSAASSSASAAPSSAVGPAARGCRASGCGAAAALGGLYGIRESGPVPSLQGSLEFSDSDDGGVTLLDLGADGCGRFVVSSGLGVEALRQQLLELGDGSGSHCHQPSTVDTSAGFYAAFEKADLMAASTERRVIRA